MKYKLLGQTGLQVSELCFGTMSFGGDADAAEAAKMFGAARDAGINFFDCADVYNRGEAERILGQLISNSRDELVITSKCGVATSGDVNDQGVGRRHIKLAVERSLDRLQTDRIDILLTHRWSDATPIDETLRALEDLVRDGKVLHLGASNYSAWQVAKALGISASRGWSRFEVIQPMYNLVKRQAEVEILPLAVSEQVGVMSYGPVGGGLLSGKYGPNRSPDSGRLVSNKEYHARYDEAWAYQVAADFTQFAESQGIHPVSLAVAWVKSNPAITCPIIGARSSEQLAPSLDSVDIDMPDSLRLEISALSRDPAPATDRLEEKPTK